MPKKIHQEFLFYAPAKINLFLQVLSKKNDGYHEIITDLVAVDLYDEIKISPQKTTDKKIIISKNYKTKKTDLILKTILLLEKKINRSFCVRVKITKKIPLNAGLGGGSSNAATMLLALNRIFDLQLSIEELVALAKKLGSDVAFFLYKKPMRMEGRGEIPLAQLKIGRFFIIILKPSLCIATKDIYQNYKIQPCRVDFDLHYKLAQVKKISVLQNNLYATACTKYPILEKYRQKLQDTKPLCVQMSGSGSSFFAIYQSASQRDASFLKLQASNSKNDFKLYACSNI